VTKKEKGKKTQPKPSLKKNINGDFQGGQSESGQRMGKMGGYGSLQKHGGCQ